MVAAIKVVDGGEAVSERKRAYGGGQNSTLKKAVSEQSRGKSASHSYSREKNRCLSSMIGSTPKSNLWTKYKVCPDSGHPSTDFRHYGHQIPDSGQQSSDFNRPRLDSGYPSSVFGRQLWTNLGQTLDRFWT